MSNLAVPAIPVFYPGMDFTSPLAAGSSASMASNMHDSLQFLLAPPVFRARCTAGSNPTAGSTTAIPWATVDEDTYGGWGPSQLSPLANTIYVAQVAGWYSVQCGLSLSGIPAAGQVIIPAIAVNGGSPIGIGSNWGLPELHVGVATPLTAAAMWEGVYCLAGDQIQLQAYYSGAASLGWDTTTGAQSHTQIVWMGM